MKRWWGIRHLRFAYHAYRLGVWVENCQKLGLGIAANPADIEHLEAIRDGRA